MWCGIRRWVDAGWRAIIYAYITVGMREDAVEDRVKIRDNRVVEDRVEITLKCPK